MRNIWIKWSVFLLISGCAFAQSNQPPAAVVNGENITLEQVQKAAEAQLEALELRRLQFDINQERDKNAALESALGQIIEERLLAAEAKKRNITVDALVQAEVENSVAMPSDEAVVKFYEENQARINGTLAQLRNDIQAYLRDQERDRMFTGLIARLKKDYSAKTYLEPARSSIETAGHPSKGPANAAITIVEFSDFECPYCAGFHPTLQEIEKNYKDKLRIVYRQYPLTSIHPNAQKAAEASLCANEQNKFWELHDAMFQDQRGLTVPALKQKAAQLSLDEAAFSLCLDSGKYVQMVRNDILEGTRLGVSGTPAFFVNGRFFSGNLPYAEVADVINDELQRQAEKQ